MNCRARGWARGLVGAALALPAAAYAQAGAACDPQGTQPQVDACAVRDFQAADAQLHIGYGRRMDALDGAERNRLRHSQRAWLRQREPACKRETGPAEGGAAWSRTFYACLQKSTENRTAALAQWPPGASRP